MKTIIFDFDGTIANSLEAGVATYNQIAREKGYKQITSENRDYLRNLSAQRIISELGVSLFDLPTVAIRLQRGLHASVSRWKPEAGMPELISKLKSLGHPLVILTSNSGENVNAFLREHKMSRFDDIHTGSSVFGKARLLKQILIDRKLATTDAVYVGDEIRDIEGAKKAGIQIISVTWGLNSRDALANSHPDFLIDKPAELLSALS